LSKFEVYPFYKMPELVETKVIQVSNVAPSVTKEQLQTLFEYIGRVSDIQLYPDSDFVQVMCKVCYIKFEDPESVGIALHLTSTVFLDRALIVLPVLDGIIPDETTAMRIAVPGNMGAGQLPLNHTWSSLVYNQVVGHVVNTIDPRLIQLCLPQYPPLPASTEPVKLDEIRRTVLVSNLDPSISPEQVMELLKDVGEVKYMRQLGDDSMPFKTMLVEFTYQASIAAALQLNGATFMDKPLVVQHSTTAIVKQQQTQSLFPLNMNKSDFDEVLKKVKDPQSLISAMAEEKKKRSRSRSGSARRRSRSKSRRRSRSPRGSRRRSRSREHSRRVSPKRRSRSPRRRRSGTKSPSRDRKKRKSRTPSPRRDRRRSPSPRSKRRDRSPSPSKKKDSKSRDDKDRRRDFESSRKRDKDVDRRDDKSSKDRKSDRDRDSKSDSKRSHEKSSRKRSPSPKHSSRRSRSRSPKSKSSRKDKSGKESSDKSSSRREEKKIARDYDEEEKGYGGSGDDDNGQRRGDGNESDGGGMEESASRQSSPEGGKAGSAYMDTDD
jgi:arginine/serine-rich splicing factor 12